MEGALYIRAALGSRPNFVILAQQPTFRVRF